MSRVDEMLAEARAQIVRYTPAEAWAAEDVLLVDLRPDNVRGRTGVIPGSVQLICAEGYSSRLAAASLVRLGADAGDLEGGFDGWVEAGLPVQ